MREAAGTGLVTIKTSGGLELAVPKLIAEAGATAGFAISDCRWLDGGTEGKPAVPHGGRADARAMNGVDICRIVKRRLKAAGLPTLASPHSFRACAATDLLLQGVALEDVQYLLGHSDSRVTKLYDRRQKQVTRNIVKRI